MYIYTDSGVPKLIDPVGLLLSISGRLPAVPLEQLDCDELTAFLLAITIFFDRPAEVVTVAADPSRPSQFTHVYLRLRHRQGGQIPFDLTAGLYPGIEPMHVYRRRAWQLDTPIDPLALPATDRAAGEAVAKLIEAARTSALHPEFQRFLKALVQWLLERLSALVRQEQERPPGTGKQSGGVGGEGAGRGEDFLRDLSEADLRSFAAWVARCLAELQDDRVELRKLLESRPEFGMPEPSPAQAAEWSKVVLERILAHVASSRENRPGKP